MSLFRFVWGVCRLRPEENTQRREVLAQLATVAGTEAFLRDMPSPREHDELHAVHHRSNRSGRTVRRWCWAQPPRTRTPSSAPPWPQQDAAAPPAQGPQDQGLYGHAQTPAEMCLRAPSGSGRLRHFAKIRADRADTVSASSRSPASLKQVTLFGRRAVRSGFVFSLDGAEVRRRRHRRPR